MKEHKFFGKEKIWISLALACALLPWQSAAADTQTSSAQNADAISSNAVSTQTSDALDSMEDSETAEKAPASTSRDAREAVLSMKKDTNKLRYDSQDDVFYEGEEKVSLRWIQYLGHNYYVNEDGHPYRSMFLTYPSSGDTYYVGPTGIMLKGISRIAGDYYYFTESGKDVGKLAKKVGWYTTSEGRVFAAPGGKLYHDQFITFGPQNKYYMGAKGVMQTGKVKAKGTVYDIAEDGRVKMGAHRYTADGKTYYAKDDGEPYRNIFLKYPDGRVMLMGEDGSQLTGISLYRGVAYRFDDEGYLVRRSSAYEYQGKTYFSKPDGKPYRNQLLTFGSKRAIYMGADGSQQTGIIQAANGNTYYADPKTGNVQRNLGEFRLNGRTYHSGNGYALTRGFIGNCYFGPHRLENTTATINGRTYRFDANGKASLVNTYSVPGEWSYGGGYLSGPAITDRHVGNNFAVVSLRHQYMWVFHNGKLAVETPIISGKPVSPTLQGNFNVQYMEKGRYLTGPGYKSWVDYWVPFSGSYGIHDAPWQRYNRFYKDSKSYTWAGSHGCVNVMPSVMPRVYAALYQGNPVTVY